MANSEAQFRTELVHALKKVPRCNVQVMQDRYFGGRPDLYIKHPSFPALWLELKFLRRQKENPSMPLALSNLQRLFIAREQMAGGRAGWALCVRTPYSTCIYAGVDADQKEATQDDFIQCRKGRDPHWDMENLLMKLTKGLYVGGADGP